MAENGVVIIAKSAHRVAQSRTCMHMAESEWDFSEIEPPNQAEVEAARRAMKVWREDPKNSEFPALMEIATDMFQKVRPVRRTQFASSDGLLESHGIIQRRKIPMGYCAFNR